MRAPDRELFDRLQPVVARQGVDLVDVGLSGSPGRTVVRLIIHRRAGVSHEDCVRVTRNVERFLEDGDELPGTWRLEVSSPGTERVLRHEREFEIFRGDRVCVRIDGEQAERIGKCAGASEGQVVLELEDGSRSVIPWERVRKAKLRTEGRTMSGGKRR